MKLELLLQNLYTQVAGRVGLSAYRSLGGGLGILMLIDASGNVILQLSRQGVDPADKELETVIKYLPKGLVAIDEPPSRKIISNTHVLRQYFVVALGGSSEEV